MLERFGCVLVWGGAWDCCNCQLCRSHFLSLFPNMERHQWESIRTSTFSKYSVVQCAVCIVPHADHSKEWKLCNSCVDRERPSKAAKCRWYHHCTPNTLLQAGGHSKCASIDVQCQAQADTFLRFSIFQHAELRWEQNYQSKQICSTGDIRAVMHSSTGMMVYNIQWLPVLQRLNRE